MAIDSPDMQDALQARYSSLAILLHWTIALVLAFQLALGFAMPKDESGFALYQLHKSVGITILLLSLVRLVWRLTHRPPAPVERGFTSLLATVVHFLLYVFMIATPLAGWALVSSDPVGIPTVLYGVLPWPHLPLPAGINQVARETHALLGWLGLALIVLHVVGALRHQLLLGDGVLRRMAPAGKAGLAFLFLALCVAIYFGTGVYVASPALDAPKAKQEAEQAIGAGAPMGAQAPKPKAEPGEPTEQPGQAQVEEPVVVGPPQSWSIQPGGRLEFTVGNGATQLRGHFSDWSGTIRFDPERPETGELLVSVRLASATVGDATMDTMLLGPEFLATSSEPVATWRSARIRRTAPGAYSATGNLTLKGATRPQALKFVLKGDGPKRHVTGTAEIDRKAFAVGTGEAAAGLSGSVTLRFAFDALGR